MTGRFLSVIPSLLNVSTFESAVLVEIRPLPLKGMRGKESSTTLTCCCCVSAQPRRLPGARRRLQAARRLPQFQVLLISFIACHCKVVNRWSGCCVARAKAVHLTSRAEEDPRIRIHVCHSESTSRHHAPRVYTWTLVASHGCKMPLRIWLSHRFASGGKA